MSDFASIQNVVPAVVKAELLNSDELTRELFADEFTKKRKSILISYVLLLCLGAHYIYLGKKGTWLLVLISCFLTVGFIWLLFDALRLPGMIRSYNDERAKKILIEMRMMGNERVTATQTTHQEENENTSKNQVVLEQLRVKNSNKLGYVAVFIVMIILLSWLMGGETDSVKASAAEENAVIESSDLPTTTVAVDKWSQGGLLYSDVIRKFYTSTAAQLEEYSKEIKGRDIRWSGGVCEVERMIGDLYSITLFWAPLKTEQSANQNLVYKHGQKCGDIVLSNVDKSVALKLDKSMGVFFSGKIHRFDSATARTAVRVDQIGIFQELKE